MPKDQHGLAITTSSEDAAQGFDGAFQAYLKYRADLPQHLARTLAADPEFGLAHCLSGYLALLSLKLANVAAAAAAARAARAMTVKATAREQAHVAALEAWIAGDIDGSLRIWDDLVRQHPTDLLAFRLAHFHNFWLGRRDAMRASAEQVLPNWDREMSGYGTVLSCRCFAEEECGDYATAESSGRAALEFDPADLWGLHGVAHVMEMQGRRREGIDLLEQYERYFTGGNNFIHHLWWHRAMFHLEEREFDAVLKLYDRRFRNLTSPLVEALPDLYIDVQNAASMLFRLERHGIDVGSRWIEIAEKAEQRIGDCLSAFTEPHWMMALAATGRDAAAQRLLAAMHDFGRGPGAVAQIVGTVALPVSEAVLAHRRGEYGKAVDRMRPVLDEMHRLGGSHAQQDVLQQVFLDSAVKANRGDDVRRM
ncbi:MAG TPA: tetratricopeptide repeat protein, partial [Stellaceae bacterium]|nr:tetratricopeptide repeat protein [Stellaceae bacterium]